MPGPTPELLPTSWQHGAFAAALIFPAMLLPALGAAGRTIVSFKAERARDLQAPLWQRLYLDLLLMMPALYGYQQLQLNGMIGVPGVTISADDPFRNPLLLLAPALLLFALALVSLRVLPRLLSLLAWFFARLPGVAIVTALRFLSRTPRALPQLRIAPEVRDLFAFRFEDFALEGYDPHPHIAAPVAV